jgi:hypothetical protein
MRIHGLGAFVEAPAPSADEKLVNFHRKVGAGFRIFAVAAPLMRDRPSTCAVATASA